MNKIDIKPLTVNQCWQGKRFKTPKYKSYITELTNLLPDVELLPPPYRLEVKFGLSSKLSDIDNPLKPFIDILQKKYNFNDRDIMELFVKKHIVKKGSEFIEFKIVYI